MAVHVSLIFSLRLCFLAYVTLSDRPTIRLSVSEFIFKFVNILTSVSLHKEHGPIRLSDFNFRKFSENLKKRIQNGCNFRYFWWNTELTKSYLCKYQVYLHDLTMYFIYFLRSLLWLQNHNDQKHINSCILSSNIL